MTAQWPVFRPTTLRTRKVIVTTEWPPEEHALLKLLAAQRGISVRRLVRLGALFALDHLADSGKTP